MVFAVHKDEQDLERNWNALVAIGIRDGHLIYGSNLAKLPGTSSPPISNPLQILSELLFDKDEALEIPHFRLNWWYKVDIFFRWHRHIYDIRIEDIDYVSLHIR